MDNPIPFNPAANLTIKQCEHHLDVLRDIYNLALRDCYADGDEEERAMDIANYIDARLSFYNEKKGAPV